MDVQKLFSGSQPEGGVKAAPASSTGSSTAAPAKAKPAPRAQDDVAGFDDFLHGATVSSCHKSVRLGFMRKVYGIVSAQLAITALVSAVMISSETIKTFVQTSPSLLTFMYFVTLGVLFALMANRQKAPLNFYLLAAFTVCESFMVGTIVSFYDVTLVLQAVVLTASVTVGLTLFAFQTKRDFTPWMGSLISILWIMIFASFLQVFFPFSSTGEFLYCILGAIVFSVFIIVDTQMMMHKLSSDEYMIAAINLYLDILNLFLYILRILSKK